MNLIDRVKSMLESDNDIPDSDIILLLEENKELKDYILELQSYIRLTWDYLPKDVQQRVKDLEK